MDEGEFLAMLNAFNKDNVPQKPVYVGLYSLDVGVPYVVKDINADETSKGPCMRVDSNRKAGPFFFFFNEEEPKILSPAFCAVMRKKYTDGSPFYFVCYEKQKKRSVFFVAGDADVVATASSEGCLPENKWPPVVLQHLQEPAKKSPQNPFKRSASQSFEDGSGLSMRNEKGGASTSKKSR